MRKAILAALALALLVLMGLWATAFGVSLVQPDGHDCVVIGYAQKDGELWNVLCYADGWVLALHFRVNFSPYEGFHAKLSRMGRRSGVSWRVFVPRWTSRGRTSVCNVHLLLAVVPLSLLEGWLLVTPPVRRSWRRRRGLCVGCAYDLRGATSTVCSECGHRNDWVHIGARAPVETCEENTVSSHASDG